MRFLFGIVVGIVLTVGLAWMHDTGALRFGPEQAFVNWDAVIGMLGR
ncbi:MAG: hypothetical protein AB7O50_14330 [Pseudolabrys sp.]